MDAIFGANICWLLSRGLHLLNDLAGGHGTYQADFCVVVKHFDALLRGAGITLLYAFGTIVGGLVLGVLCGTAMLSRHKFLTLPFNAYVQFFRCTPLLVQIVWFYYALPMLLGYSLPAWMASGLGLTLYMGAFCAEIFRGGIQSIDRGQWQAARALGMTYLQLMRRVILPQAMRRMIPPFTNQSVLQLKNTSLLYVVAGHDLMYYAAQLTSQTFRPFEFYTTVAMMYFVMLYPATKFAKRLEARVDI
ncbi:MAG: amino acid ABC transporter permease [Rhodospirillales bacterium]|nr:amino acid ABC transporter permease [Rhodospirillales bacterium]